MLPYLSGHTLPGSLRIDSTPDEEARFADREAKLRASGKNADFEEYVIYYIYMHIYVFVMFIIAKCLEGH